MHSQKNQKFSKELKPQQRFSFFGFLILIFLNLISGCTTDNQNSSQDVRIAFFGDQGLGDSAIAVLELVKSESADAVVHLGDFDYTDAPSAWNNQIDAVLGNGFPYFAVIGNHDAAAWEDTALQSGYQTLIANRLEALSDVNCSGDIGVDSVCTYKGVTIIFSGIGTIGDDAAHLTYLEEQLQNSESAWKICAWHKNHRLMQAGGKDTEVDWEAYEICRTHGALIATGHEHSYSRTYLMNSFENQTIASVDDALTLSNGKAFAFVSGLGGKSVREQNDELAANPWWASVYTATQSATYGALFCDFHSNSNFSGTGDCYFKTIDGEIIDTFSISSEF